MNFRNFYAACVALALGFFVWSQAEAQTPPTTTPTPSPSTPTRSPRPEFSPFSSVSQGFTKVSSPDGQRPLYTLFTNEKTGQILAELPSGFASQKHFIATTIAGGDRYAGNQLQGNDLYVYWRRYDKRLALIEPNVEVLSTGDAESRSSVQRLFTDRVILDVPILTMGPSGGPVVDLNSLLLGQSPRFFGTGVRVTNPRLSKIKTAKAFPQNIEVAFEVPVSSFGFSSFLGGGAGGQLQTLHYSISVIPGSTGYSPRTADERVGYFVTGHDDYGQFKDDKTRVRYINRWHLKKRDPSLKLSPPEQPIVFYVEHTTPVRYRRWVRQGVEYWNKAFEQVGLLGAIEVKFQDAKLPPESNNMEKDPEDVRYNFIRWLNNNASTAIGPSRVNPTTGQILDADIILTDGWIRYYLREYRDVLPKVAMEGFGPETLAWLDQHPRWDPRIRLAPPSMRNYLVAERARRGPLPFGGYPMSQTDTSRIGDDEFDGLVGRTSQINGMCLAALSKSFSVAQFRMMMAMQDDDEQTQDDEKKKKEDEAKDEDKKKDEEKKDEEKKDDEKDTDKKEGEEEKKKDEEKKTEEKKEPEVLLDGIPESFIGPLIADLVAHEVGHTLGLRHNFKASSIYSLEQINSEEVKGKKPLAGSVMDYLPTNMMIKNGKPQGDYGMIDIGEYDKWAIEYGYTFERNLKPILDRVAEPELRYATDEDTYGPDPLARRYDFGADPLAYAKSQMELAAYHRQRLLEKFVKDGQSWSKAREGYELSLAFQVHSIAMMANWIGGSHVHRDKKGDKNGRAPVEAVGAEKQRAALDFVINNTFADAVYGLTPELLKHMTVDKWLDGDDYISAMVEEPTWPVHDRIMGIQASTLTMLMNPTTLRRVYDNEFRVPADTDMLTLPELLDSLTTTIWSELEMKPEGQYTARKPLISSLRRNLQREHLERLMDMAKPDAGFSAAYKPIANLATMHLRRLTAKIAPLISEGGAVKLDPYSLAHLSEAKLRIDKALDAVYIYNTDDIGGGGFGGLIFLKEPQEQESAVPEELRR